MQNFTAVGRLRRLEETKMWQNRDLGLDPGLNSPETIFMRGMRAKGKLQRNNYQDG